MLKNIDPLLSGELLRHLDELGHGESLVLADRNYPAYATGCPVVRLEVDAVRAATAILGVLPLDRASAPLARMEAYDDPAHVVGQARRILQLATEAEGRELAFEVVPRFDFYDRARGARLVVLTREEEPFNDYLFVKGVV